MEMLPNVPNTFPRKCVSQLGGEPGGVPATEQSLISRDLLRLRNQVH